MVTLVGATPSPPSTIARSSAEPAHKSTTPKFPRVAMDGSEVDWGTASEVETEESSRTMMSFAGHLTSVVRGALSMGAWSQVTSPKSTSSNSSSSPPKEVTGAGMEECETPFPDSVEVVPGPQSIHDGTSELEALPGPQNSLTEPPEEPKVPKSKKRPQPPVLPFPEKSVTDQEIEASQAKAGDTADSEVQVVEDASPTGTQTGEPQQEVPLPKPYPLKKKGWGLHGLPLPKPPQGRRCS